MDKVFSGVDGADAVEDGSDTQAGEKNKTSNISSKAGLIAAGLVAVNSFNVNSQDLPDIKSSADKELDNPKNKKEIVVETDKKGNILYSKEDTSDKYYVSPEEMSKYIEDSEKNPKTGMSSEEFSKLSKEERAEYLNSDENTGLNFKRVKSEKESEIKETFIERWFSKKGKEKKNVETNIEKYDTVSDFDSFFSGGETKRDQTVTNIDEREINLRKSGIPKDNTYTTFRQTMQNGIKERLAANKLAESSMKEEYSSYGTVKEQKTSEINVRLSGKKDNYLIEEKNVEVKYKKGSETPKKEIRETRKETLDSKEENRIVTSYKKDGTIKRVKQFYKDLKTKFTIVGKYAEDGETVGDLKTKTKEFSEEQIKANVEEQKSKGISPAVEALKGSRNDR